MSKFEQYETNCILSGQCQDPYIESDSTEASKAWCIHLKRSKSIQSTTKISVNTDEERGIILNKTSYDYSNYIFLLQIMFKKVVKNP